MEFVKKSAPRNFIPRRTLFSLSAQLAFRGVENSAASSIFSIKIPYPFAASSTSTCVTALLKDIESLSNLSSDKAKELHGTAQKIMELDRSRSSYMKAPKRITEDNFHKMEEEEEDLPGIIDRMEKNEIYQERLRKDMSYLEGEKSRLEIERESYESSQKIVKILSVLLLVSFISLITLIFILEIGRAHV